LFSIEKTVKVVASQNKFCDECEERKERKKERVSSESGE
jgi:hypothetical protein